jgi:branched-chain amino acid transport system permease protein
MTFAAAIPTDLFRAVLQGAPPGTVYALIALGFVLAYKTSGVFNLAFGAQAYVSAVVYYKTYTVWGWGVVPSLLLSVVLVAPLLGLVLEWLVFRHLRSAPALAKLVVTIGLTLALPSIVELVMNFTAVVGATPQGIAPNGDSVFYDPFGVYAFSRNELVAMGIAVAAVLGLGALFRFTSIGLQMRSVVESPRMTELSGVASDRVSAFAWMLSSFFAGMAGVLIAPRFNTLAPGQFFGVVVVAVTAAALGRLVSLPRAFLGGIGLGILIALFNTFMPRWIHAWPWLRPLQDNLAPAVPFVVLFAVLVFVPSLREAREASDPLSGVDPPPASLSGGPRDPRRTMIVRLVGAVTLAAVATVLFTRGDSVWIFLVTQAVVLSVVFLSITVITGLAGQISLAQGAFAAIGAFATFQLVHRYQLSVLVASLVGAIIAAVVGALLSLPIRKLSGIWIAIATLAFAFFFDSVIVKLSWVGGTTAAGARVPRPVIGPLDFANDKSFLGLAIVILVVVATAVWQLKDGTIGRKLRALRGSEVAAQSIGISPARSRMTAFAISAFVAGLGGGLMAIHQQNVNYSTNFSPFASLFWIVLVVSFGAQNVSGAIVAASMFSLFDALVLKGTVLGWILRDPSRIPGVFPVSPTWRFIVFGLGTIQFARHPEGMIVMMEEKSRRRSIASAERRRSSPPLAAEEPVSGPVEERIR